ncbi:unnamed protein product [Amoebophrya sp. A25]|nr:unnamed protein product [Amoebophrya sp. A25]|eukprot:GSA25T00018073001.1
MLRQLTEKIFTVFFVPRIKIDVFPPPDNVNNIKLARQSILRHRLYKFIPMLTAGIGPLVDEMSSYIIRRKLQKKNEEAEALSTGVGQSIPMMMMIIVTSRSTEQDEARSAM